MTAIIALFVRMGLSQRLAGIAAYVATFLAAAALLALLCWGLIAHGRSLGKAQCEATELKASNGALIGNDKAKDQSAIDQQNDRDRIGNQQKDVDHAIDQAPAGNTGAATHSANCVVWRRQHPGAVPPAACQ